MKRCIFFGDSITDANHLFSKNPLGEGYLLYLFELFTSSHIPVHLYNQGHAGHTWQKLFSVFYSCQSHGVLKKYSPDLISVQIGINDVAIYQDTGLSDSQKAQYLEEYEKNLSCFLSEIRQSFSGSVFLLEPFLFPYPAELYTWMSARQKFSDVMNRSADKFSCLFVPLQDLLVSSCPPESFSCLTIDGFHLTNAGNRLLASFLWNCFKEIGFFLP